MLPGIEGAESEKGDIQTNQVDDTIHSTQQVWAATPSEVILGGFRQRRTCGEDSRPVSVLLFMSQ